MPHTASTRINTDTDKILEQLEELQELEEMAITDVRADQQNGSTILKKTPLSLRSRGIAAIKKIERRFANNAVVDFLTSSNFSLMLALGGAAFCMIFPPAGIFTLGVVACVIYTIFAAASILVQAQRLRNNKQWALKDQCVEESLDNIMHTKIAPEVLASIREYVQHTVVQSTHTRSLSRKINIPNQIVRDGDAARIAAFVFSTISIILHLNPITITCTALYTMSSVLLLTRHSQQERQYQNMKNDFLDIYQYREKELSKSLGLKHEIVANISSHDWKKILKYTQEGVRINDEITQHPNHRSHLLEEFKCYVPTLQKTEQDPSYLSNVQYTLSIGDSAARLRAEITSAPKNHITHKYEALCQSTLAQLLALKQKSANDQTASFKEKESALYLRLYTLGEGYKTQTGKDLNCLEAIQDKLHRIATTATESAQEINQQQPPHKEVRHSIKKRAANDRTLSRRG